MHLGIISSDPIQSRVLAGAAKRRGWMALCSESVHTFAKLEARPDAVIVDVEYLDEQVRHEVSVLAARLLDEPVFLLAEQAGDVLPAPEALRVHALQFKPFDPSALLRMIEASIADERVAAEA